MHALARHGAPNWHLIVIGTGPQEMELIKLANTLKIDDRIDFLGFRQDRLSFLKGFDVFVLASFSEGTPRCVMEAMAARIPVAASDIEGCRNLIRHGETGMLFPAGDSQVLAERIHTLTSDSALLSQTVSAANSFINTHYSAARMAREYEKLFITLTATTPASQPQG